jgi:hypothetical protein
MYKLLSFSHVGFVGVMTMVKETLELFCMFCIWNAISKTLELSLNVCRKSMDEAFHFLPTGTKSVHNLALEI